jgi:RNA polymerase sigma-70 factor (ECF subfamily)
VSEEERRLLEAASRGDLDAFAAFVRHFERRVRGVLFRLLDDERDVEEATQDTFVQAWRNLDRFHGEAAPFTWLYRIAVNEALMRRRRRRLETVELEDARSCAEDSVAASGELSAFLVEQIRALPIDHRAALVLRDVEGLSSEEVARVLDISVAAAKSRIHRARMTIRAALEARQAGEH